MVDSINIKSVGEEVKKALKKCGEEVTIHPLAKIIRPEVVEIGNHCGIDDFCLLFGGNGITIGNYVHIPSFCSVIGGGEFLIGDCATLSAGVRIITGTDNYYGGTLMSASCLPDWRNATTGNVVIGPGAFIGTNSVIMPNVKIGECAVVGALTFVNKDLESYGIYVGSPAKKIGYRDEIKSEILEELKKSGINVFKRKSTASITENEEFSR